MAIEKERKRKVGLTGERRMSVGVGWLSVVSVNEIGKEGNWRKEDGRGEILIFLFLFFLFFF